VPGDVAVKGPDSYIVGNKAEDDVGVGGDDDGVPPSNNAKRGKKVKKRREGGRGELAFKQLENLTRREEESVRDSPHGVGCVKSSSCVRSFSFSDDPEGVT